MVSGNREDQGSLQPVGQERMGQTQETGTDPRKSACELVHSLMEAWNIRTTGPGSEALRCPHSVELS